MFLQQTTHLLWRAVVGIQDALIRRVVGARPQVGTRPQVNELHVSHHNMNTSAGCVHPFPPPLSLLLRSDLSDGQGNAII